MVENGVEERPEVFRFHGQIGRGDPLSAARVNDREVRLFVGRPEFDEQVENERQHFADAGIGAVDLIDDDDRLDADGEGFLEHEARLRQRPLGGVHQQKRPVGHFEDAFDFAAEVGVARRVDEVHLHVADADAAVFGENGDAALAFLVVRNP